MNTARLLSASAVVFAASAITTVVWCGSMSAMPCMVWMRMPGQSWSGAAATFIGMWAVMMIAMMIPSLVPMLSRYQRATGAHGGLVALVALAYFLVWTMLGAAVFPLGIALGRAVPFATAAVVMIAGALQFSAWKARQLSCCRAAPMRVLPANPAMAFRHGLRIGLHCVRCCAGLTAVLLVVGVMDLRAMALVTGAISAERLLPGGERVARVIGTVIVAAGLYLFATGFTRF